MKKYYYLLFLVFFVLETKSQEDQIEIMFSGFADTYHAVRSKEKYDFMSSRSRLRAELNISKGKSYLFTSLNAIQNSILNNQSKIELREAYFQYTTENWDLKTGRQIIIWGIADGMRISDNISPMDYSEFLARDYDDIRVPVNALNLKYLNPNYNFELVFIPVPEFFILPTDNKNPWSISSSSQIPVLVNTNNKPGNTLRNSEYGGRFSFYLKGLDFSLAALHTWNKMPAFRKQINPGTDTLFIDAYYKKMDMLAVNFSAPLGQFVIRGECAAYLGELQEQNMQMPVKKNALNSLLGVDWYPGYDWTLTTQYNLKHIINYNDLIVSDRNTNMATLGITKKVFRSTLSLSTFAYIDLNNEGFFNRFSADYSLTDQIHIIAGYDWFNGEEGMFGMYKNNSEYWIKAKYSF